MAVAEKSITVATTPRNQRQVLMMHGVLGALYFLASLWLVFLGLPTLWRAIELDSIFNEFLADSLLFLVAVPLIFGLFVLGRYLEGPRPVRGLRAAAFYLSFCILVGGLLITCGSELWEVIGLVALAAGLILYFQPFCLDWLVRIEEQGWFHAVAFKPNQGLRVRRATVIGLMVIAICGIVTLVSHGSLRTGRNWLVAANPFSAMREEAVRTALRGLEETQATMPSSEVAQQIAAKQQELDKMGQVWAPATDPWMVYMPFGTSRYVFMFYITLTVPILIFALSSWLSWRLVSWPTFADFLIATEAEMNKVSWTTRKRLYQDTIVVLTTVVLLTLFLFVVDILWIKILTNPLVDVLKHDPQAAARKNQVGTQW